jgi:hypothetical protein
MAEQSAGGAEFQVLNYGAIRSTERSVASTGARCRARSNPQETQSAKCGAPSQIGGLHGADKVERGAICVKQRMPSVEHGAIHDRCRRRTRHHLPGHGVGAEEILHSRRWLLRDTIKNSGRQAQAADLHRPDIPDIRAT